MFKRLTFLWTAWKLATKRLGPVGGAVAAVAALAGVGILKRLLRNRDSRLAKPVERVAP